VREALRRLEGDGHLVRDRTGSLRPGVPSVQSMREVYDVRIALEVLVTTGAAMAGDRGTLEALDQDWSVLAGTDPKTLPVEFVHEDESFHQGLAEASGNAYARRLLADINERIRPLRIHEFVTSERVTETIAEHREILAAVLSGEPGAAGSFMRAHVERSALVARRRMRDALARMST
jgi:DNA-binding GntR family transcriptional regulator